MGQINLVKNILFSTVSTLTTLVLFLLLVLIGKIMGVESLGVFTFALAFVSIFELILDFGLRDTGVRNVARDLSLTGKYQGNLLVWQGILFVLLYGIMILIVNVAGYEPLVKKIIYILGPATFLRRMKFVFRLFFQTHDRFDLDTLLVLLERGGLLLLCGSALIFYKDLVLVAWAFLAVRIIDFTVTIILLHKKIHPVRPQFDGQFVRDLQLEALPRGLYLIVFILLSYIDTIMLREMIGYQEVGIYNAAYKIYEGVNLIPMIFYFVVLPRLSQLYVKEKERHQLLANRIIKYMFVFVVPVSMVCFFFSDFIIQIYKPEFIRAASTLRILSAGLIFHFPLFMLHMVLMSADSQKIILRNGLIALLSNVALNLFLIPRYGSHGAALATVFSEIVLMTLSWACLAKLDIHIPFFRTGLKPLLAGGAGFALFMSISSMPVIVVVLASLVVYGVAILLFRVFEKSEVQSLVGQFKAILIKA